ncbi:MAG TPA: 4-(cytidine 5'-diphospho)-2-C-methyl-D-erythritol kinase [Hyphomicrobiales bacterium]
MSSARVEKAPAKVNLTLRVIGRRADGYHEIESLVVFAALGDTLRFVPDRALALVVRGPTAAAAGVVADNLVLKAACNLADRIDGLELGRFDLSKRLPVAAGLGGGSTDAAAALRILARTNQMSLDDHRLIEAARATGADVPVCLDPRPRMMRGIGDVLSEPLDLPRLAAILVNPGVAIATKHVFDLLELEPGSVQPGQVRSAPAVRERTAFLATLANDRNDLEMSAISIAPAIADVLAALRASPGCRLARMSGSGGTCFGLFDSPSAAAAAAGMLRSSYPGWWVRATMLAA